jgi:hypothetical protein
MLQKLYICRRGQLRQGHNAVALDGRSRQEWARILNSQGHNVVTHDGRSRQEWARTLNAVGHGVMSLTS